MSDTAAHLVDRVFPEAPVRQWVLSLPIPLRYRLAYDHKLCSAVLGVFLRSVFGALQRRAREELGVAALLIRRGLLEEDGPAGSDPLAEEEPLLAACAHASVGHRIATGLRAGKHVMRLGDRIEVEDVESRVGEQCAAVQGFSLHGTPRWADCLPASPPMAGISPRAPPIAPARPASQVVAEF